jgi:hypothetical protein
MPHRLPKSPSESANPRLALEGFSAFERQALQSYFRLSTTRQPAFEPGATLADCAYCVVDADRPAAVEAVRLAQRQGSSIYVGAKAPEGAAAHLPRPIDPRRVASALDALAARTARPAADGSKEPAPAAPAASAAHAAPTATRPPTAPAATARPTVTHPVPPARTAATASRKAVAAGALFRLDVLVVDDIDIARRFLAVQLERLGCRVVEAASADEALARLDEQRFRLVFADVKMSGLDGLVLCRHIKQGGAGAPAVVLVGAPASPSDRVRGLLSGCDEQLAKPIGAEALVAVLNAHSNRRRRARQD